MYKGILQFSSKLANSPIKIGECSEYVSKDYTQMANQSYCEISVSVDGPLFNWKEAEFPYIGSFPVLTAHSQIINTET